jgi:hypothetical protein
MQGEICLFTRFIPNLLIVRKVKLASADARHLLCFHNLNALIKISYDFSILFLDPRDHLTNYQYMSRYCFQIFNLLTLTILIAKMLC